MGFPFTLDEIEAAYRETGLKPMVHDWLYRDEAEQLACPLAALCLRRLGGIEAGIAPLSILVGILDWEETVAELLGLSRIQVLNFLRGLTDNDVGDDYDREAYRFGRAVAARLSQPVEV
jgi:hypothetical protein